MLDNILYPDVRGMTLDVDVTNSGSSSNVLYKDVFGFTQQINEVHSGSATGILYIKNQMQTIPGSTQVELGFGYSG